MGVIPVAILLISARMIRPVSEICSGGVLVMRRS